MALCLASVPLEGYGAGNLKAASTENATERMKVRTETLPETESEGSITEEKIDWQEERRQLDQGSRMWPDEDDKEEPASAEEERILNAQKAAGQDDYPIYRDGDYSFFSEDGKTACIKKYDGKEKEIKVPQTLSAEGREYTVTCIKEWAFVCEYREITYIEFPETLKTLEEAAFSSECRHVYLPRSITKIEGRLLSDVQYYCWENSYAHRFLKKQKFTINTGIYCIDNPPKVRRFYAKKRNTKECTLGWEGVGDANGYAIASCDKNGKINRNISGTIKNGKLSYTVKGLKSNKVYHYRICAVYIFRGKEYYGEYSHVLTVRTKPSAKSISAVNNKIKKGYTAKITQRKITLPAPVCTTYDSLAYGYHARVSELTNFWDNRGRYNLACASTDTLYIVRYSTNFKKKSTVKIKKKYPLVGDVVCDDQGNYYVVWGNNDTEKKGNCVTIAVSKYTSSGKHVRTSKFKTTGDSWDTRYPFEAGNCSTIIKNGTLHCLFAREMYDGHQSSTSISVNTSNGKKGWIGMIGVSHSFDQRIIALKNGGICEVDQGDAHPARGFLVNISGVSEGKNGFHFFGEAGVNRTNAWLGGVCETDSGIFLSGASAKSMTTYETNKNMFIQIVYPDRKIKGFTSRKGTSAGKKYTDKGIKWLTNYSAKYDVANPKIVGTEDNRMVIMWEKFEGYTFVESYYMILAGDGTTLQKAMPMNKVRLASFEDPMYKNGKIYWTTTERTGWNVKDTENIVNCLEIGKFVKP